MPEVLKKFLATRARTACRTVQSDSVVVGNVLGEER
jgi:hypothetical protein